MRYNAPIEKDRLKMTKRLELIQDVDGTFRFPINVVDETSFELEWFELRSPISDVYGITTINALVYGVPQLTRRLRARAGLPLDKQRTTGFFDQHIERRYPHRR